MFIAEREQKIIEKLRVKNFVKVDDLSTDLGVSPMTIRRDFDRLEGQGIIKRAHGGAILLKHLEMEKPYSEKELTHCAEKNRIANEALRMIGKNNVIILDSGTTTYQLSLLLKERPDVTVITNDLKIANILYRFIYKTIIIPGEIQKSTGTIVGSTAIDFISTLHVDWAFLGTNSINQEWDLFAPSIDKSASKKKMITSANHAVLLADSSKFEKNSFSKVCNVGEFDFVITDKSPSDDFNSFCLSTNTSLIIV